jgi:hypothetical protein
MRNPTKLKTILTGLMMISSLAITSCSDHKKDKPAAPAPPTKEPPKEEPALPGLTADGEAPLRGYANLSRLIGSSMATSDSHFEIASYVGGDYGNPGLALLMGYYDGNPVAPGWRNASPNTASVTVYLLAFDAMGRDLAESCKENGKPRSITLKNNIMDLVKSVCVDGVNASPDNLHALWSAMTAKTAPEAEFTAWLDTIKESTTQDKADLLSLMTSSAMMVPHFIIQN